MAHIPLPEGLPGIFGLIAAYPGPAEHLAGLAQALLRGPSSLTPAEREMIAADLTRKRRGEIVDRVAAAYILQGCLDFLNRAMG